MSINGPVPRPRYEIHVCDKSFSITRKWIFSNISQELKVFPNFPRAKSVSMIVYTYLCHIMLETGDKQIKDDIFSHCATNFISNNKNLTVTCSNGPR